MATYRRLFSLSILLALVATGQLYPGNELSQAKPKNKYPNHSWTKKIPLNNAIGDYLETFKEKEVPFSPSLGLHPTQEISDIFRPVPFAKKNRRHRHFSILLKKYLQKPSYTKKLKHALIKDPDSELSKLFLRTLEVEAYLTPIDESSSFFDSPIHAFLLNRSIAHFIATGNTYPTSSVDFLLTQEITKEQLEADFTGDVSELSTCLRLSLQRTYRQYEDIDRKLEQFDQCVRKKS